MASLELGFLTPFDPLLSKRVCSQTLLAPWEFNEFTKFSTDGFQSPCRVDFIIEICRPKLRCTEQQSEHNNIPLFTLAQEGSKNNW